MNATKTQVDVQMAPVVIPPAVISVTVMMDTNVHLMVKVVKVCTLGFL